MDAELARLSRGAGALRFQMGRLLDALARGGRYRKLAFSTLELYGLERCERSSSWVRESRSLARRVEHLPLLRKCLISGSIGWSMALELVRVATPESEAEWIAKARDCTVGQVKALVKAHRRQQSANGQEEEEEVSDEEEGEETCFLTITGNAEDFWMLEAARTVAAELGEGDASLFIDALVMEATSSLVFMIPTDRYDPADLAPTDNKAQNAWNRQLEDWRGKAEEKCERNIPLWKEGEGKSDHDSEHVMAGMPDLETATPEDLDAALRRTSAALGARDAAIGELANEFFAADGWRQLGYATARQYSRERLGMAYAALKNKRQFARGLSHRPAIRRAHQERRIGYEGARVASKVATPATDAAWAERAAERTVLHLKEEARVAEILARVGRTESVEPPPEETVNAMRRLKTDIVTGAVFREGQISDAPADGAKEDPLADVRERFYLAYRTPPHLRSRGRKTIRLPVRPDIRAAFRALERFYAKHRPTPYDFLYAVCRLFIEQWAHMLPDVQYAEIYARDGLRCISPVCGRRGPTPHHTRFRSRGGTDDPENVISLCIDCHLNGVHAGHMSVTGDRPNHVWQLANHTLVEGRKRTRLTE